MQPLKFINTLTETEPELARREYITRIILFFAFIVALPATLISFIVYLSGKIPLDTLIIYTMVTIMLIAAIILASRGMWRVAGIILPLLLYYPAVHGNYIGGINQPGNFFYALIIISVAIIYGYRKMWIAVVISLATYLFLAWMIANGHIIPYRSADGVFMNRVVNTSVALVGIAFMVWILSRSYRSEIDVRVKAEESLRESEENYRAIFETANNAIFLMDQDIIIDCNPKTLDIFGCTRDQIIGQPPYRFSPEVQPDGRTSIEKAREKIEAALKGQPQLFEWKHTRYDGTLFDAEVSLNFFGSGRKYNLQAVVRDITDRKLMEEALRESEEKFRYMTEHSSDVIWHLDRNYCFDYISPADERIRGFMQHEVIGTTVWSILKPEGIEHVTRVNAQRLADEKNGIRTGTISYELELICKDGSWIWTELNVTPHHDQKGELIGLHGVARDISDRKRAEEDKRIMEERLQQADKMEAIGILAGGIAHDFNNLLMGIQGYASLTLRNLKQDDPAYEMLLRIEEQVQSGADLTRQLLGFARGGRYEVKSTDMDEIIEKTSSMFGRTKKEISIHRQSGKDLWSVEADRGQMEQVFMNLYVNAWQAMPGGGNIYLATQNALLNDQKVLPYSLQPGKYVKITITDTGIGMDEKTRERIFEPFFTTNKMGRGTGLGLATVYGIIKGHGGMINVYSESGHGTTFTIYLPASEKEVVTERPATVTIVMGTETILMADDEKMVMEVNKELLETLGYKVYAAGSGQEAIAVYMEKKDKIDLVILDMIMPGISGAETFDRIREINPDVRVLLSSGYSLNGEAQAIINRGCKGFIQKPFRLEELSGKVREVLSI